MKYNRTFTIIMMAAIICSGCNQNEFDNIDAFIPEIGGTDHTEITDPIQTNHDTGEAYRPTDTAEQTNNPFPEYEIESYDNTYEGSLQKIYDILYRMIEDVALLKDTDQYNDTYDTYLSLMKTAADGHEQKNQIEPATVNVKGMLWFYDYDRAIDKLFDEYPEQAAKEDALIEFTRYFCYMYSVLWQGSTENFYQNDALYAALFPNTENLISKTDGVKTTIQYEGYTGELVVLERANRINSLRGGEDVFSETAEITNYTGTVSVAPINQYGAVGRTSHLYVSQNQDDSIVTSIYINGDTIMINPDITSQEFLDMQNQKEIRSVKENYLDSINNVPYLSVLQISHCELSDTSLLFSKIPMGHINTLDLSDNDLEELDLSSFSSLDSLDLNGNYSLQSIKMPKRKSILYLGLRNTSIDSLAFLSEYETIANIDIRDTAVSDFSSLAGKNVYNIDFDADITDYTGLCDIKGLKTIGIVSSKELSDDLLDMVKSMNTICEFYYNDKVVPLS